MFLSMLLLNASVMTYAADEVQEKEPETVVLTVDIAGQGSVVVEGEGIEQSGDMTYVGKAGTMIEVETIPSEGHELTNLTINGQDILGETEIPRTDSIICAVFEETTSEQSSVEEKKPSNPETEELEEENVETMETPMEVKDGEEIEQNKSNDAERYLQQIEKIRETYAKSLEKRKGTNTKKSERVVSRNVGQQIYTTVLKSNVSTITVTQYTADGYEILGEWSEGILGSDTGEQLFCADPTIGFVGGYKTGVDATNYFSEYTIDFIGALMYWYDMNGCPGLNSDNDYLFKQEIIWTIANLDKGWHPNSLYEHGNGEVCDYGHSLYQHRDELFTTEGISWAADNLDKIRTQAVVYEGDGQPLIKVSYEWNPTGTLELQKASAIPEITAGNSCYSLEGAVYGLYQNGNEITRLTTNSNGYAKVTGIDKGSYILKEIIAPKGYALDRTEYSVTINSNQLTRADVKDYPQSDPVSVLLGKVDAETTQNMPQGSASLEGAEFTIKYYNVQSDTDPAESGKTPVRTWVMRTDERGFTRLGEKHKVSGDEFYFNTTGDVTLPLGTITIQESKAPEGYLLNDEIFVRQITSQGAAEQVETYNAPTIPETPQKGIIQIQKKSSESDYGTSVLEGAVYEVKDSDNKVVDTLTTDAKGKAQSKELPWGSYTVKEKTAPSGFLIDETTYTVDLTTDNKTDRIFYKTVTSTDVSQRGIIRLQKKSSESDYGASTLAGAVYEVKNSNNKVVDTLTTDKEGKAQSKELPWGSYTVKEKTAPSGFLVDETTYTVDLTTDNKTDRVFYKSVTSTEVPQRGVIRIQKKSSESDYGTATLKGAEYSIYKDKACTDKVDTLITDAKGAAQSKELPWGTYYVKETKNPSGFLIDETTYTVDLTTDNKTDRIFYKTVTSTDVSQRGIIRLQKKSSESDYGASTLAGAVYEVKNSNNSV